MRRWKTWRRSIKESRAALSRRSSASLSAAGNVKKLQGIDPPEFRLRVGDYRVRFH
jgi:mRNA-degrading endonuclease RelE of RelBE toxin-antitoxin system